jgi:hypothetical protein
VSFRARLLFAFLFVILVAMIVFAFAVRREVASRLTAQYQRRVNSLVVVIEEDLEGESDVIAATLEGLRDVVANDNDFRRAAVDRVVADRRYLLDFAGTAMRLTGLSMLQVQDEAGRIISSGHFRNEFDRLEPELPELLGTVPGGWGRCPAAWRWPGRARPRVPSSPWSGPIPSAWVAGNLPSSEERPSVEASWRDWRGARSSASRWPFPAACSLRQR